MLSMYFLRPLCVFLLYMLPVVSAVFVCGPLCHVDIKHDTVKLVNNIIICKHFNIIQLFYNISYVVSTMLTLWSVMKCAYFSK